MLEHNRVAVKEDRLSKIQKAVENPDYRLKLLVEGDPELDDVITAALRAVELIFRTAGAAAAVSWYIRPLHQKKANHQRCTVEF